MLYYYVHIHIDVAEAALADWARKFLALEHSETFENSSSEDLKVR